MAKEVRHVGVRMPVDLIDQIDKLADAHDRDRSGEIIRACRLYVSAHRSSATPETYYALLKLLEELRSKLLEELEQKEKNERKNPDKWVKVEEGWID